MNKFKLIGTITIRDTKTFQKGDHTGKVVRFTINYKVSSKKNTTFVCSTFNEKIIEKLKTNDYVELTDYIPVSDRMGDNTYFNSLIVRDLSWIQNKETQLGAIEEEIAFGGFDVNSYQENNGEEDAQVEVPLEVNQQEDVINVEELLK